MSKSREFTVRPLSLLAVIEIQNSFRIYLSPAAFLLHQLKAGDLCRLWREGTSIGDAIAWPAPEKIQDHIVQTSKTLQRAYDLSLGVKVTVTRLEGIIEVIDSVQLREVHDGNNDDDPDDPIDAVGWQWYMKHMLAKAHYVAKGMIFEGIQINRRTRTFEISSIDADLMLARFESTSKVTIGQPAKGEGPTLQISAQDIGGLARPIEMINEVLMSNELAARTNCSMGLLGMLLYGPRGTGKSLLLEKIAATGWGNVSRLDPSTNVAALRKTFTLAKRSARSVILIDKLELWTLKSDGTELAIALLDEMRLLAAASSNSEIVIVGATHQLSDLPDYLRGPEAFQFEIEILVPNTQDRVEIMKSLSGARSRALDALLEDVGGKTHGYTGADLLSLLRMGNIVASARRRQRIQNIDDDTSSERQQPTTPSSQAVNTELELTEEDLNVALLRIRPSALREFSLEVPTIKWSDIGGQEEVKKRLREAVEWPLRFSTLIQAAGVSFQKGVLLYGPPGCSKTLTAKALATEGGYNFIAVKGPELLNMYVGESERKLRNVFERARAASPCIIFLDEIDTIAGRHQKGQSSGVHCLETLLNEMDGIEGLRGVFVLAATNKPDVLDLALLRPGRLEPIYVGPPDFDARVEILTTKLKKMDAAPTIEIQKFAEGMEGHSGAEIVDVCDKAWRQWFHDTMELEPKPRIEGEYFEMAMGKVLKQISPELRKRYEAWKPGAMEGI